MENTTTESASRRRIPFEPLFRWFFTWRVLRFFVAGFAVLVTLVALFYAEEDWRGKRAWEKYKHELEAKGAVLDWAAYISPPVPDDQNIFKAPRMTEWFVGRGHNDLTKRLADGTYWSISPKPAPAGPAKRLTLAELTVVPADGKFDPAGAGAVVRLEDPAARVQAAKLIETALGPAAPAAQGFTLMARPPEQIQPVHVTVLAETMPAFKNLAETRPTFYKMRDIFITKAINGFGPRTYLESSLEVEFAESNSYRVVLVPPPTPAAEYLSWSDQFEPDFDLIREALKRPYARMDGDYEQAYAQPIPNFVAVRYVAQTLSQRALCQLLLGQPDKALRELTLLHGLSRLLEAQPTGKPMTLVAAMINVAITGLYVQTVSDGFQLRAWREPQITELQKQLGEINLPPQVAESFRSEGAGFLHTLMTVSPTALANQFLKLSGGKTNRWAWFENPMSRFIALAPRGWIYQNMVTYARWHQMENYGAHLADGQIHPDKSNRIIDELSTAIAHHPFYAYLAARAIPNYTAAIRTLGYQQTRANEALIACALERCHLAHGQYPETLAALVPQFLDTIPHDLIGGQPLKYHRTDDDRFVLYSVGWDEKDDGGTVAMVSNGYVPDNSRGDWVWPQPPAK